MSELENKKNEQLQMIFPELASKYAKFPLQRDTWLAVDGTGPGSATGFVAATVQGGGGGNNQTPMMKEHYVYGLGSHGLGHYHLLTRESYKILHLRASHEAPTFCCCGGAGSQRDLADAWHATKTIVYNRSLASIPNDALAAKEAEQISRQIAQGTYNRTQNEQLVIHALLLAT